MRARIHARSRHPRRTYAANTESNNTVQLSRKAPLRVALAFTQTSTAAALRGGSCSQCALRCRDLGLRRLRDQHHVLTTQLSLYSFWLYDVPTVPRGNGVHRTSPRSLESSAQPPRAVRCRRRSTELSNPNTVCTPKGRRAATESQVSVRAVRRA